MERAFEAPYGLVKYLNPLAQRINCDGTDSFEVVRVLNTLFAAFDAWCAHTDAAKTASDKAEMHEKADLIFDSIVHKLLNKENAAVAAAAGGKSKPAPAAPAKRELVVDNDGTVSAAPEPKRQACGDKKDPIVLE